MTNIYNPLRKRDLIVELFDAYGILRSSLYFDDLTPDHEFNVLLRDAYNTSTGHLSLESRRQIFRCCRKFGSFFRSTKLMGCKPLPDDIVFSFRDWLGNLPLNASTSQSILNSTIVILRELSSQATTYFSTNLRFDVTGFRRGESRFRHVLSEEQLKAVLDAALHDLDACSARIAEGRDLLHVGNASEDGKLLRRLLEIGNGKIPATKVINKSGESLARRLIDTGGVAVLNSKIFPNADDLIAAYIALLIQTSGNPYAIYQMEVDCIRPHALRSDVEWLVWMKERSKSEQKVDCIKSHRYSATSIVRMWLDLTSPLRKLEGTSDRERLLIAMTKSGPRQISFQLVHLLLDKFIERHRLTKFDFKDIRSAEANLIYKKTHDIREVKIRLNHRSSKSTVRYLKPSIKHEENREIIGKFQGLLFEMTIKKTSEEEKKQVIAKAYDTLFGFKCKDPFSGIAEGSKERELCPSFQKCATCPGAIVPLDDVQVVARLIRSRDSLLKLQAEASSTGWLQRFNDIYAPTLRIIEVDLLSRVHENIVQLATEYSVPPLPRLE